MTRPPALVRYRGLILAALACAMVLDALVVMTMIVSGAFVRALIFAVMFSACLEGYLVTKRFRYDK